MELEVGMYVRFKSVDCIFDSPRITKVDNLQWFEVNKDIISKASHNIIDLIEVGDYVNGYKVYSGGKKHFDYILTWDDLENYYIKIPLHTVTIKSIVTKEQFESMQYKIN